MGEESRESGPVSGWFDLRASEQAVAAVRSRPMVLLLPAGTIVVGLAVLALVDVLIGAIVVGTGVVQLLTPLVVVRRQMGQWAVLRRVGIALDGSIEVRNATGRASRWAIARCRTRIWKGMVFVEVLPGRAIAVPRRAFVSPADWHAFVFAIRAGVPSTPHRVEYRSDPWSTRPFDLPLASTVGVVARQQAMVVAPVLMLATGINALLAPTLLAKLAVLGASAALGVWAVGGAATLRVNALARHEITKRNVARVGAEGFVLDGPGVSMLRPWSEVTAVRRRGRSVIVRSGRHAVVLPASAFHDQHHVDSFTASLLAAGVPLR